MRGKAFCGAALWLPIRITPAYAGKRRVRKEWWSIPEDHPRVCGEKCCLQGPYLRRLGSPPRVRGKVEPFKGSMYQSRITPACAGKSVPTTAATRCIWDHPRVCGEKTHGFTPCYPKRGSPPRVRGKGTDVILPRCTVRITPACAGKSHRLRLHVDALGDHPRVCGEKKHTSTKFRKHTGSPPRVRGKVPQFVDCRRRYGITPACAGKSCFS